MTEVGLSQPSRASGEPAEMSSRRRAWLWGAAGSAALLLVAAWALFQRHEDEHKQLAAQEAAASAALPTVVGLGYLEPTSTVVTLAAPASGDAARVAELRVAEGDAVQAGQLLAVLDSAARLEAQLDSALVQVDLKRLMLARQRLEIDSSLKAKRAALARALADLNVARAEYQRQHELVPQGAVSEAQFEASDKDFLNAQANVDEKEAALRRTEAVAPGAIRGHHSALIDVAVTEKELAAAEADARVARASLDQARVLAPFAGRVIAIKSRAGERVGSEGLLELGAVQNMRAVIEVYQTDIHRVRIGQDVELHAQALPGAVKGSVQRIGMAVKRQTVINNDPATSTDARVIDVIVALDPDTSRALAGFSRLQTRAVFMP
jgi:HlyD family secretion protein